MVLDLGDSYAGRPETVTVPSDGSGSAGDLVEIASGQASQMAAGSTGTIFGVLAEDSPAAGEDVVVWTDGQVVVSSDGGTVIGEAGVSAGTAGAVAAGSSGNFIVEGEAGARLPSGAAALEMR